MITLLTAAGLAEADAPGTRTGGVPLVPPGFEWPRCRECGGFMQFLAQVRLDDARLLSIFMCQNDPGLCDEWDPVAGGNHAFVFGPGTVVAAVAPDEGETLLGRTSAVDVVTIEEDDYFEARERWSNDTGRSLLEVLGQLGGQPDWLQGDETPDCAACERPMSFVVQLEEGSDHRTSMNFGGGGCGYGFRCTTCDNAAFLWQR